MKRDLEILIELIKEGKRVLAWIHYWRCIDTDSTWTQEEKDFIKGELAKAF